MKQYMIPYNFAKEGYVYGKITWSSMVQAIILVGAAGSVIFRLLPFPFKVRMYLAIFILLPLAVLALKGIHELSLFSFLQDFFQTVKDRGLYEAPGSSVKIHREQLLVRKEYQKMQREKAKARRMKKKWLQKGQTQMKMKQLRHEKKIYRELERMRKSRTFESSTDRTGQEPDDFLNMSAAQRLRMIHAEKMSVPKAERKTPDAKADQLPLPTTLAVDFLPIKKIKNGTIYTDDGRYVKVLEVLPINFLLKSREEQEQVIYDFEKFLRIAPDNFQIKVLAKKTDISSYLQRLNENIACEPDEKCRAMMEDSRKLLIDLGQNEAISRRFFLAFEAPKQELRMQTEEEIERVLCRMRDRTLTYLQNCGNRVAILGSTTEETAKIFFDLLNRTRISSVDFPKRVSEVYRYYDLNYGKAGTQQIPLTEYVTPKRLDFRHSDYLQMDDTYYQTYYVRADSIPARVGAGWTACIINAGDGVDVDLFAEKKDRSRYIERIGRRLRWKGSSIKGMDQSTAEYDELSDRIASGYYLKNGLSGGANTNDFYYFALIVTISAPSLEAMRQKAQAYIDYLKSMEILLSPCDYEQVRAFHSYLPLARCDRKIFSRPSATS